MPHSTNIIPEFRYEYTGAIADIADTLIPEEYAEAYLTIASQYEKLGNLGKSFSYIEKAAEQGHMGAKVIMATYYNGQSFDPPQLQELGRGERMKKAVELWTEAAEQGIISAECNLGTCYITGVEGVLYPDIELAIKWLEKAAQEGSVDAAYNLANCYYGYYDTENCSKKNFNKAAFWYIFAACSGDSRAQYNLGICYAQGNGVETNGEKAIFWIKEAAKQGFQPAVNALEGMGISVFS